MSGGVPRPLLLAAALLVSCGGSSSGLTQVRGEVRSWTYGAGTVELLDDDLKTLSSAAIDTVGRFTLPLPGEVALRPLLQDSLVPPLDPGCTNTVKASTAARYYEVGDLTAFPSGGTQRAALTLVSADLGEPGRDPQRQTRRLYLYVDRPVQVSGNISCPLARGQGAGTLRAEASYALSLKSGWNTVASVQTVYRSGASQTSIGSVSDEGFEGWQVSPTGR